MRSIRNCPVCVVGGAGFLGSHFVDTLVNERKCQVLVIDNLSVGRREFVHPKAKLIHHDITKSESRMKNLFEQHGIRFVANFAAMPYVPVSFARPLHVCEINFTGAVQVINAAQEAGVEAILQISSAEIYGNDRSPRLHDSWGQIKEECAAEPHSSYGISKAAVDSFVQVRWREAKTPAIALRQFNCVGIRDVLHPYVIPEIARQLNAWKNDKNLAERSARIRLSRHNLWTGVPVLRLGNNSARDFLDASDQARMAVELLEKGEFGGVYNLGSESCIKIYDLAKLIGKIMGFEDVIVEQDPDRVRPYEIWHLASDNRKIYSVIEARPQVSLEESLRRTIAYFEEINWQFPW